MASLEDLPIDTLASIARLSQTLAQNPDTRADYLRLIKKANPGAVIPEIDAAAPVMAALNAEREKREALEARLMEDEARRNVLEKRNKVMAAHKFNEEQMVDVEKIMTDHQIPNYETAAKYYDMERRAATPTTSHYASPEVELPSSDVWKGGMGNKAQLDRIAREQARIALNEITGGATGQ